MGILSFQMRSTFYGDMQRWTIYFRWQKSTADKICFIMNNKFCNVSSFVDYLRDRRILFPGIYSQMMNKECDYKKYSIIWTMFGWSNFFRNYTSFKILKVSSFLKEIILHTRILWLFFAITFLTTLFLLRLTTVEKL